MRLGMLSLRAIVFLSIVAAGVAQAESGTDKLAYAKASPLLVYKTPEMLAGESTDFDFGRPYSVFSTTDHAIGLDVEGERLYVKRAHVTTVSERRFVATQESFKYAERAHIRFWSSSLALSQFLFAARTGDNAAAFEEYLETAPGFSVHLPVIGSDMVEVLSGDRQASIANVMVPISRRAHERFEEILAGKNINLQVALLADASGSTAGFLEPAVAQLAEAIARDPLLHDRISTVDLSIFGEAGAAAYRVGPVEIDRLSRHVFFDPGSRVAADDVEALVPALKVATQSLVKVNELANALIVLAGADVELVATERGVSTEVGDVGRLEDVFSVFVQVTPEPGTALESASRMTRGSGRFVPFASGSSMASKVLSLLKDYMKTMSSSEMEAITFEPAATISHSEGMISLLPMNLLPESHLPPPPPFAMNSDWYTASLWLAVDGLVLKYGYDWSPRQVTAPPNEEPTLKPDPGVLPEAPLEPVRAAPGVASLY